MSPDHGCLNWTDVSRRQPCPRAGFRNPCLVWRRSFWLGAWCFWFGGGVLLLLMPDAPLAHVGCHACTVKSGTCIFLIGSEATAGPLRRHTASTKHLPFPSVPLYSIALTECNIAAVSRPNSRPTPCWCPPPLGLCLLWRRLAGRSRHFPARTPVRSDGATATRPPFKPAVSACCFLRSRTVRGDSVTQRTQ
jgi:hypothetical protein